MNTDKVFYQLSESQKSIWYLEKAYPGTSINIIAGTLRMKGEVSYSALEKALNLFVKKSDAMRLRIHEEDGVATQSVVEYEAFKVDHFDFSNSGGLKQLFIWDEGKTRTPFNVIDNPLFYCATFKVSGEEGGFYMKMHHLCSDAWTMGIFTRQVVDLYSKIRRNEEVDDSPNPSFIEHLANEAEYEKSDRFLNDKAYWSRKFETLPEMTVLKPMKSGGNTISAKRKTLVTPLKLSNKIREFCALHKISVFTLFMSVLSIYINRVTGIEDIVLGTTILNRTNLKEKETPGMFVSVAAPVRISISDTMDFLTFSKAMLVENMNVLRHQKYPYNYMIRDLKKAHKHLARLFDIVLNYQNSRFRKDETEEEYTAKWIFSEGQVESLVISVNDREDSGNLIVDYDFLTDVFNIKEIEFLHQHIISLLWHALDNPSKKISKLEMISEKEKHTILYEFNNTFADYPRDKTLHQIFEEQVEKTPDNTALIFGDRRMTYAELNEKSNRLAHTLRDKGIGPDKIVGIKTYRSFEMMIGILGILKAGGAYMPIDPDYPAERKNFMLKNSRTGILLAQSGLSATLSFEGLIIDLDNQSAYSHDASNLPNINTPRDLAYVIYTSGSTGNPKGVMVEHSSVVNRLNWMQKKYPLDKNSIIMQKTTYTFDVSVWELFWWSFAGASVCLVPPGGEKDPEAMIKLIERHEITTMHFVPSMLSAFLYYVENRNCASRLASLKNVFASGEALSIQQVHAFNRLLYASNGTLLSNLYGPTEATVDVSYFNCSPMPRLSAVPIGKPIDNISLYILDKNQNLLPVGIPGELYIGGVGVARGYLNNPELTSEKFVINPYKRNEILYRTGDRARWYPKGDIEFLGRADNQVKLRGFRIELGEIEARILSYPNVREAAVRAFTDECDFTWLAAYVSADKPVGIEALSSYLSESLPAYMVPAAFTFLNHMPKTANGKMDRNALPRPEYRATLSADYSPSADDTEAELVGIWQKVLGVDGVGVLDEYTAVGGDSLKAIMIIADINRKWGIEVSPKEIFQTRNIRELAKLVKKAAGTCYTPIPQVEESPWYPASAAQKRIFAESQIGDGTVFNMPLCFLVDGIIECDKLKEIFNIIIRRHESLRTSFDVHDGVPVQIIHQDVDFDIEESDTDETDIDKLMTAFIRPFDLTKAPLFRIKLIHFSGKRHLFMMNTHHIISDGASLNIIVKEMTELLRGKALPETTVQYKDFTVWHNEFLKSDEIRKQETYWLNHLSGDIPVLDMPTDFSRPLYKSLEGNTLYFTLDEELTRGLKRLASLMETTLYMVLISAYGVLLSKYTGQEDIIIGINVEGRNHSDLRNVIGVFFNTPVARCYPNREKSFKALLAEVKEELLNVYDNQDYPFEELASRMELKQNPSRSLVFDTLFMMQNIDPKIMITDDLVFEQFNYNSRRSIVDICIGAYCLSETITCRLEYCTKLFRDETMRLFAKQYENVLWEIVKRPSKKIKEIRLMINTNLSKEEEATFFTQIS